MVNIYVGNLPFNTTAVELEALFAPHGDIGKAVVIMDKETGRSRGFGFVEMPDDTQGRAAVEALNGQEFGSRVLTVNEARPRPPRTGFSPRYSSDGAHSTSGSGENRNSGHGYHNHRLGAEA
jgi:RNA recognition motif-containing protein